MKKFIGREKEFESFRGLLRKNSSSLVVIRGRRGDLSNALKDLMEAGFLARDYTWSFATGKRLESSRYRIRDNYLRFYLKYILPHKNKLKVPN